MPGLSMAPSKSSSSSSRSSSSENSYSGSSSPRSKYGRNCLPHSSKNKYSNYKHLNY